MLVPSRAREKDVGGGGGGEMCGRWGGGGLAVGCLVVLHVSVQLQNRSWLQRFVGGGSSPCGADTAYWLYPVSVGPTTFTGQTTENSFWVKL